ncbi:MAG: hypothetical protein JWQ07_3654 [Ramlibacter sp.]|nr:hypothetical protein [Ramlibacter sp.]
MAARLRPPFSYTVAPDGPTAARKSAPHHRKYLVTKGTVMHNRMPSRRRQGNTVPQQGAAQQRAPRAPHERDESADSQAPSDPAARRIGKAAHDDVERGQVDTGEGPVLDQVYDKVREGADDPVKKFSP